MDHRPDIAHIFIVQQQTVLFIRG